MNTLDEKPRPVRAWHRAGNIVIELSNGRTVGFPISANDRLRTANPSQLNRIELSPFGIHWPKLDEDLSLRGILQGRYSRIVPRRRNAERTTRGLVRLQLQVSRAARERIQKLARKKGKTMSAVVEERFA